MTSSQSASSRRDISELEGGRARLLAPMAGVGDVVMRTLCREQGAALTYTEMISAKGLMMGGPHRDDLLVRASGEDRCAVQLFGHEPEVIAKQAARIEDLWGEHLALIDINMGCPVPKVTRKGEGSALMKTPELAARIISETVAATDVPVTCKFRRGWGEGVTTAVEFAKTVEDAGASAVCVHGRYATQLYRGKSDPMVIRDVKDAVSIPVIGNGDLFCEEDIETMFSSTGCDAVMIARGALGNPWIFSGIVPDERQRLECALRHARLLYEIDPTGAIRRMRKHIGWYVHGVPHATDIRKAAMTCRTLEEFEAIFRSAIESLDEAQ